MDNDSTSQLCNTQKYRENHNNNIRPVGGYFDHLEEENFYLRTQLQKLLQELHLKEELINGTSTTTLALGERQRTYDSDDNGYINNEQNVSNSTNTTNTSPSQQIVQPFSVRDKLQVLQKELSTCASLASEQPVVRSVSSVRACTSSLMLPGVSRTSCNTATSPGYELGQTHSSHMHNSSTSQHQTQPQRSASNLESKLEALERKYELQAQRHQQLTNELTQLRHQTSIEMDQPGSLVSSAEVQTSPENDMKHWPLPGADAVHGSPQRSCATRQQTVAHRRSNLSDSQIKGAQYSLAQHDPLQVGCSTSASTSRLTGGCSTVDSSSMSAKLRNPTLSSAFPHRTTDSDSLRPGVKIQVTHKPSHDEIMQWIRDRPNGSRLFRALFQYLPYRDSPNDNPESELALEPGDYVLVHGELDEDLFYEGELFNGQVGLVPSNYVERVSDSELYATVRSSNPNPSLSNPNPSASAQTVNHSPIVHSNIKHSSPLRHSAHQRLSPSRSGLVVSSQCNVGPAPSSHSRLPSHNPGPSVMDEYPIAGSSILLSSGVDFDAWAEHQLPDPLCPYPPVDVSRVTVHEIRQPEGQRVPCPRDILVEKQLQKSLVISWSAPENSLLQVSQYHVCVDGLVKAVVPGGYKHKALIEDVDLNQPHRVSVRAVTEKGHSPDASCTVTVGLDASVAPQEVRTCQITPVSVQLSWYPSNSNCEHIILLNGVKVGACPSSVHQVLLKGLSPSTMYRASVRTKDPRAVLEERPVEGFIDFKTLPKIGLPDPPAVVQCDPGPQDGTLLISWKPVQNQPKPPSRAAVAGYLVYADGRKVSEINTPSGDHLLLRLSDFIDDPPLFITVRTRTREGAISSDSNVVRVPRMINPATGISPKRSLMSGPIVESSQLKFQPFPSQATMITPGATAVTTAMASGPSSMVSTSGGLLMVQPSSGPTVVPGALTQQTPLYSTQVPQVSTAVGPSHFIAPSATGPYQTAGLPTTMHAATYGMWPSTAVTTISYTTPSVPGQTSTAISSLGTSIPGQYYVFHPKLSRADPSAVEKPSLLEMENSYLVKHSTGPFAPALPSVMPNVLTGAQVANPNAGIYALNTALATGLSYPNQNMTIGAVRTLPVIDPSTGLPFRSEHYAAAWQTLSPATRRRLAQYVNQQPSGLLGRDAATLMRRDGLARKRAIWRKRSYSADEQMEDLVDSYGRVVPQIRPRDAHETSYGQFRGITGASGSEGPGSVVEFSEEDWAYSYPRKAISRRRTGYYQERSSSRAQSEPDLRVDQRIMPNSQGYRLFVALYDYDPRHMSPNPNAIHEELSFRKGQVIKVYGQKDLDGFYQGEHSGRIGLIPSNMVAEMDKNDAYALRDPYRSREREREYEPYYEGRRAPGQGSLNGRRRSDAGGWTQNNSDPLLSRYRGTAPTDYESSESMERYGPPINPRVRRMRFAQVKSQSYDYGDKRRGRDEHVPPAGHRKHGDYTQYDYDSDRRYPSEPPYSSRSERGSAYYRGSLEHQRGRDHSLPARTPPEEYPGFPRRAHDQPPYDRIAGDRPRFQVGSQDYPERARTERDYYDSTRTEAPRDYTGDYRRPEVSVRDTRDRYYDERRADYREDRAVRDSQPPYDRDPTYPQRTVPPAPDEERYRSDVDPRMRRGAQDYPPTRGADYNGAGRQQPEPTYSQSNDTRYGQPQPPPYPAATREPPYYDRERRRGSFRRGGRDQLEQSIREAIKDAPARKMIAKFDYDPRELSPNVDAEQVELNFRSGDLLVIYGEMDEDGFYIGELNGKRGLVPSNFLEQYTGPGASMAVQQQMAQQQINQQQPMPMPMMASEQIRPKRDGVTFLDDTISSSSLVQQQSLPNSAVRPVPGAAGGQRAAPKRQESVASGGGMAKVAGTVKTAKAASSAAKAGPAKKSSGEAGAKSAGQRKASQAAGPKKPDAAKKK